MGCSESSNEKFNKMIRVTFQKESYYPGETIQGEVHLTLEKPLTFTDVLVSVQVFEYWHFLIGKHRRFKKNEKAIVSNKINVAQMINGSDPFLTLSPGTYSFPFTLSLPQDVAPSFLFSFYATCLYITYSILVEIANPFEPMLIRTAIIIKSLPSALNQLKESSTTDVVKLLGSAKGKTTITASISSNNYQYGESFPMTVTIDNTKGKLEVTSVKLRFIRSMHSKYTEENKFLRKTVFNRTKHPFQCKVGEVKTETFAIDIINGEQPNELKMIQPYTSPIQTGEFWPSMNTSIMSCSYAVKATAYFESKVSRKTRPKVRLPIAICHRIGKKEFSTINDKA